MIGSIASRFGAPFLGPYCASKAALAMLTDSLRLEVAPAGIGVLLFEFAAAVRAPRPRARYVIGKQAHVQAAVAVLPHRLRDNMVRGVLRIP
jgi:NAD(P)-dependent dehydrogenase (short-subunit alcohol dehydrogenase family)